MVAIFELFDKTLDIEWISPLEAVFYVHGKQYLTTFSIRKMENEPDNFVKGYEIVFSLQVPHPYGIGTDYGNTGTGDQFAVYSTVLKIIETFITKNHPMFLTFSGNDEDKKNTLYEKMIEKMFQKLQKFGYQYHTETDGYDTTFILWRD